MRPSNFGSPYRSGFGDIPNCLWRAVGAAGGFRGQFYMEFGACRRLVLLSRFLYVAKLPPIPPKTLQHKTLVLRRRYWLYYLLTFLSGARRQIFVVFAAFLMVEKFGYSASQVTLLFLINYAFNWFFAERIGALIHRIGERRALTLEYIGLIFVFVAYGLVDDATLAAALYVIDHMFFAMAIAISTYFQKIADPKDMASTAGSHSRSAT